MKRTEREPIPGGRWLLAALLVASVSWMSASSGRPTLAELARSGSHRIEVGSATAAEWRALPGIGASRARELAAAGRRGELSVPEDVLSVRGIGPSTFARLRPYLESTR